MKSYIVYGGGTQISIKARCKSKAIDKFVKKHVKKYGYAPDKKDIDLFRDIERGDPWYI